MRLTGKCEIDFKKWRIAKKDSHLKDWFFEELMPSMQYGVYIDFFDSVWIDIETPLKWDKIGYLSIVDGGYVNKKDNGFIPFKTRQEARTAAIKKANEIYNLK